MAFGQALARKLPNLPKSNIRKRHVQKVYTCIFLYSGRYDLNVQTHSYYNFGKITGIPKSTIYVYSIYHNYYVNYTT